MNQISAYVGQRLLTWAGRGVPVRVAAVQRTHFDLVDDEMGARHRFRWRDRVRIQMLALIPASPVDRDPFGVHLRVSERLEMVATFDVEELRCVERMGDAVQASVRAAAAARLAELTTPFTPTPTPTPTEAAQMVIDTDTDTDTDTDARGRALLIEVLEHPAEQAQAVRAASEAVARFIRPRLLQDEVRDGAYRDRYDPRRSAPSCLLCGGWCGPRTPAPGRYCTSCGRHHEEVVEAVTEGLHWAAQVGGRENVGYRVHLPSGTADVTAAWLAVLVELQRASATEPAWWSPWLLKAPEQVRRLIERAHVEPEGLFVDLADGEEEEVADA